MRNVISQSRSGLKKAIRQAAKDAKVSIDVQHLACAFSEEAALVNVPIAGADEATSRELKSGLELLFVYFSLPKGTSEKTSKARLSDGYYIVKVSVDEKTRKGSATLLTTSRRELAQLPLNVSPAREHGNPKKRSVRVSGHINWCGFGVDALWKAIVIEVNVRWC